VRHDPDDPVEPAPALVAGPRRSRRFELVGEPHRPVVAPEHRVHVRPEATVGHTDQLDPVPCGDRTVTRPRRSRRCGFTACERAPRPVIGASTSTSTRRRTDGDAASTCCGGTRVRASRPRHTPRDPASHGRHGCLTTGSRRRRASCRWSAHAMPMAARSRGLAASARTAEGAHARHLRHGPPARIEQFAEHRRRFDLQVSSQITATQVELPTRFGDVSHVEVRLDH